MDGRDGRDIGLRKGCGGGERKWGGGMGWDGMRWMGCDGSSGRLELSCLQFRTRLVRDT